MKRFWITLNMIYERIMLFVFILALLIVCYGLYDAWYVYHKADDNSLLKYKPTAKQTEVIDNPITEDMVGWITIDDTNVDYPIMQSDSNTEYLNKDPYGNYSLSGSIFLDSRNSSDFSDDYSILYGHHMEYGKMFGALDDFLEEGYLQSHQSGKLIVGRNGDTEYQISIFACAKVNVYDNKALDPQPLEEITKEIQGSAQLQNTSIEKSGHILALSTCTEPVSSNRLIVFAYINE